MGRLVYCVLGVLVYVAKNGVEGCGCVYRYCCCGALWL